MLWFLRASCVYWYLLCPSRGAKYCDHCVHMCLSVCLSALAYLKNMVYKLHQIFDAYCLWSWLSYALMAALQYVNMCFRFWRYFSRDVRRSGSPGEGQHRCEVWCIRLMVVLFVAGADCTDVCQCVPRWLCCVSVVNVGPLSLAVRFTASIR